MLCIIMHTEAYVHVHTEGNVHVHTEGNVHAHTEGNYMYILKPVAVVILVLCTATF